MLKIRLVKTPRLFAVSGFNMLTNDDKEFYTRIATEYSEGQINLRLAVTEIMAWSDEDEQVAKGILLDFAR